MSFRVVEWAFRNKGLEAYYARDFEPSVLAVQKDLSPQARRVRELEAHGYEKLGWQLPWADKYCYAAASLSDIDPDAVEALRITIDQEEPGWVERVREHWPGYWNVEAIAYWSGVPLQATYAILLNMQARGELDVPEH